MFYSGVLQGYQNSDLLHQMVPSIDDMDQCSLWSNIVDLSGYQHSGNFVFTASLLGVFLCLTKFVSPFAAKCPKTKDKHAEQVRLCKD